MTAWNDFVKKIYHEGHNKNPNYQFKQALKDASKRKSEMGSSSSGPSKKMSRKSKKSCMKSCKKSCSKRMRGGMNGPLTIRDMEVKVTSKNRTKRKRSNRKH